MILPDVIEQEASACATKDGGLEVLRGKSVAVVVFSHYPSDPRPRRAAEALARAGMRVEVISLRQQPEESWRETVNGVNILRVPLKHWRGGKLGYLFQYGVFILASSLVLAFRSLRRRYYLVHVHNMPDILVFSALAPKARGARIILDLHDPMPELMTTIFGLAPESAGVRLLRRLEKWSIRFADVVLTPNAAFEKLFSSRGCPPEKVRVVMNSPDEKIFQYRPVTAPGLAKREEGQPFVILYHGALVERHGVDLAVEAVEAVRSSLPGVELRICGRSTPFLEKVMAQVAQRGLQRVVRYRGAQTLEGIVREIDECDLGIIPNRQSVFTQINMPTRIFEYLARGKPVIAPRTQGIRDYFSPGQLLFFEPGDARDLARTIQQVYAEPREISRIVMQGQAVYRAHTWNQERSRFLTLVSGLLSQFK